MNQNSIGPSGSVETLADVPEHILQGLPEEVRLLPSTVDKTRLGVWATKPIFRGRKFGPFVGDKKKRSQVKSNVYMWEVYYPNLGWMCVDATDPAKGNWLRYVNWARSGKEQNLFPLEINRTIYYKTLKPIEPGDELLVWYNGEENPEIAAALEEERASHRSKRNSPKARRGKKKSQEAKNKGKKARDQKWKAPSGLDLTPFDMRETKEGHKAEDEASAVSVVLPLDQTAVIQEMVNQDTLPSLAISSPVSKPPATPEDKLEVRMCGSKDLEEDPKEAEEEEPEEEEEEEEEPMEEMGEEEEEEEPEEEEEEEGSLFKENPEVESMSVCEDKLESVEEQSSLSEDSPGNSPKKKPPVKFPKTRGESNGSVLGTFLFPCQHCERKFTTKQGLERHVHIHISAISHAFKCRYCGKAFGTQINRRRHERRHEAGPKRKLLLPLASAQLSGGSAKPAEGAAQKESKAGQESPAPEAEKASSKTPHPPPVEESKEPKESHPCQYCRKVFGTHTNMRRHQRRVHERHLLPKGVRRKPEEPPVPVGQAQHAPSVYMASTDLEEEAEADDVYVMDVSSNISENLNYYIDGKIQSNSSTSNCDVIEVESSSDEVYGINCLLSPVTVEIANVKATPVRLAEGAKGSPVGGNPEGRKRRTASPPLLAKIKTEVDPEPITSLCSLTIPLAISTVESLPFPKEKSIYLSSKLKQLLQTQDNNKVAAAPPSSAGDIPKLGLPVASSPLLPATSSRFKRRTSSPQHSPGLRDPGKAADGQPAWSELALSVKPPKLERRSNSPTWSSSGREESEAASPLCSEEYKASKEWAPSPPFGNVCNQQPLDLSSSVKQRSGGKSRAQVPWESVLDLSVHKKPCSNGEGKEAPAAPPAGSAVKRKPTTSMLQKVLLNEYNGVDLVSEAPSPDTSPSLTACQLPEAQSQPGPAPSAPAESGCPGLTAETSLTPTSACQAPSVLTRTTSPSHTPCPPMLKAPTPPPPLLPTVPSPLPEEPASTTPSSCPSPLSNATTHSPLPVLSPTVSASPIPSIDPLGCASPGPPVLSSSSSSSSSSFSSSSSSSSSSPSSSSASPSCSPSPPPLSVVSSVLSPGDNMETSVPLMTFKQEEAENSYQKPREEPHRASAAGVIQESFSRSFVCNVCETPFLAIKDLTKHLSAHAGEWPFKCEFCVQLFREKADLSEHRLLLHGVGHIFVCSACQKEFAFLCNLQQHQRDLHPDQDCSHHQFESGTLRPQNFTDPSQASVEQMQSLPNVALGSSKEEEEEEELNDSSEELYTTIKIMAAGVKPKDPDVRMGLNQHYPSFKPPPFQYHHRNPNGIGATATNFTTHNIPQTFSTAIRCTKCGKSVDNMPELHKHILACASASDKKRYTPKKNPVPLKQVVRPKNGVVLPSPASSTFQRLAQPKRLNFGVEAGQMASNKLKLSALRKKKQLVQKAILQKKKSQQKAELKNSSAEPSSHICPYCSREFTYIASLNKHASYSCPQKPISSSSSSSSKKKAKKKNGSNKSSSSSATNPRRRTADAEIKMQSAHAHLGKTRARSSGPAPVQLPPAAASFRLKQSVKFVQAIKSKKGAPLPAARNVGSARAGKGCPLEGKRSKGAAKSGGPGLLSKASRKLHVRLQRSKAALAGKKKAGRFSAKLRERVGGPVTRSLQQATFAEAAESKREENSARQEMKDFRNLL